MTKPVDKYKTRPCSNCGVEFTANIPWKEGDWEGYQAPLHECGEEYRLTFAWHTNELERAKMKRFFSAVSTELKGEL